MSSTTISLDDGFTCQQEGSTFTLLVNQTVLMTGIPDLETTSQFAKALQNNPTFKDRWKDFPEGFKLVDNLIIGSIAQTFGGCPE